MRTKLTAIEAKSIKTPGFYRAGETLYLNVAPGGSKSWIQRITVKGERRNKGLGGFPLVSLAEARDKAFQNRKIARSGGNPFAKKERPIFRHLNTLQKRHLRQTGHAGAVRKPPRTGNKA